MGTLTKDELDQFTGTVSITRSALNRKVVYSDGVRYMAKRGEAFWLIDAIASHIGSPPFNTAAENGERTKECTSGRSKPAGVKQDNLPLK